MFLSEWLELLSVLSMDEFQWNFLIVSLSLSFAFYRLLAHLCVRLRRRKKMMGRKNTLVDVDVEGKKDRFDAKIDLNRWREHVADLKG